MSPRYEVDIPGLSATRFEAIVQSLGGEIKRKLPTKVDGAEEWRRQISLARDLVEGFESEQDPQIRDNIENGTRRLIHETFRDAKEEIDWNGVKQALISFFNNSLPETMPESVYPISTKGAIAFNRLQSRREILPRAVMVLIETYGIADGKPKSPREINRIYGVPIPRISSMNMVTRIQWIRRIPELRQLVLKEPQQSAGQFI